jgi:hypothetical protein
MVTRDVKAEKEEDEQRDGKAEEEEDSNDEAQDNIPSFCFGSTQQSDFNSENFTKNSFDSGFGQGFGGWSQGSSFDTHHGGFGTSSDSNFFSSRSGTNPKFSSGFDSFNQQPFPTDTRTTSFSSEFGRGFGGQSSDFGSNQGGFPETTHVNSNSTWSDEISATNSQKFIPLEETTNGLVPFFSRFMNISMGMDHTNESSEELAWNDWQNDSRDWLCNSDFVAAIEKVDFNAEIKGSDKAIPFHEFLSFLCPNLFKISYNTYSSTVLSSFQILLYEGKISVVSSMDLIQVMEICL